MKKTIILLAVLLGSVNAAAQSSANLEISVRVVKYPTSMVYKDGQLIQAAYLNRSANLLAPEGWECVARAHGETSAYVECSSVQDASMVVSDTQDCTHGPGNYFLFSIGPEEESMQYMIHCWE